MATVRKHDPVPPPPPATFDILGLTFDQISAIYALLGAVAGGKDCPSNGLYFMLQDALKEEFKRQSASPDYGPYKAKPSSYNPSAVVIEKRVS